MRLLARFSLLPVLALCCFATPFAQEIKPASPPAPALEYNPDSWKEFSSPEGKFSVLMPGVPTLTTREEKTDVGIIALSNYILKTKTAIYVVSSGDFPIRPDEPDTIKKALDGGRDNMLAEDKSKKLISEKEIVLDGQVGREWLMQKGYLILRARAFFIKGRLYQIIIGTPKNVAFKTGQPSADPQDRTDFYETIASKFLGSFKLILGSRESLGEVDILLRDGKGVVLGSKDSSDTPDIDGLLIGKVISLPKPEYPAIAIAAHASGTVVVKVVIDEEGKVIGAQAHSGHPLLQAAAVKAARGATFTPTLLEGKPVKVTGVLSYNFVAR